MNKDGNDPMAPFILHREADRKPRGLTFCIATYRRSRSGPNKPSPGAATRLIISGISSSSITPKRAASSRLVYQEKTMLDTRKLFCILLFVAITASVTSRADAQRRGGERVRGDRMKAMIEDSDKNGDGRISRAEFTGPERMFDRVDSDGDGILSSEELEAMGERMRRRRQREEDAPKVGTEAPDFTLKSLDDKSEFHLATYRDKKPVVLFFGSYT
jgi:hypothetical protein